MGKSQRDFILGTVEELNIIDKDMKEIVHQSLATYILERVLKPWVEQSPNLPDDLLELPKYVYRTFGKYTIQKNVEGIDLSYGSYSTLQETLDVREYLVFKNWDEQLSTSRTKLKSVKHSKLIQDMMNNDSEYQEYLKTKE